MIIPFHSSSTLFFFFIKPYHLVEVILNFDYSYDTQTLQKNESIIVNIMKIGLRALFLERCKKKICTAYKIQTQTDNILFSFASRSPVKI